MIWNNETISFEEHRTKPNPETVKSLEKLLARAMEGEVRGGFYVLELSTGEWERGGVGEWTNFSKAVIQLYYLQLELNRWSNLISKDAP